MWLGDFVESEPDDESEESDPQFVSLDSKSYLGISALDYLNGVVSLDADDECEQLGPEPEEGNMEYKLKLVRPSPDRFQHLVTQMNYRLKEGAGEAIYRMGVEDGGRPTGISDGDLKESIETIQRMAEQLSCNVVIVRVARGPSGKMAELLVRKTIAEFVNIRVCVVGNVDSGKSSLVGVLTSGKLDNGRGLARMGVFRHRHEIQNGRTSSISQQILGFDAKGEVTNYSAFRDSAAVEDIVEDSDKVLTLVDLAGHERYLKTTVLGLTGHVPDYVLVVVAANAGVLTMTRQHIGVTLALNLPLFVVINKIDICPPNVLENTLQQLLDILKTPQVQRLLMVVESMEDVTNCARSLPEGLITPVFLCSCVSGEGLDRLKAFLRQLPNHRDWSVFAASRAVFAIDDNFTVLGVGTTVSGFMLRGRVDAGETLLLGPDNSGQFEPVTVQSIHIARNPAKYAVAGQAACFALRKVKRSKLRKGMVLVHPSRKPQPVYSFDASVLVLHHERIKPKYQPVIHIGIITQAARVSAIWPLPKDAGDFSATVDQRSEVNTACSLPPLSSNGSPGPFSTSEKRSSCGAAAVGVRFSDVAEHYPTQRRHNQQHFANRIPQNGSVDLCQDGKPELHEQEVMPELRLKKSCAKRHTAPLQESPITASIFASLDDTAPSLADQRASIPSSHTSVSVGVQGHSISSNPPDSIRFDGLPLHRRSASSVRSKTSSRARVSRLSLSSDASSSSSDEQELDSSRLPLHSRVSSMQPEDNLATAYVATSAPSAASFTSALGSQVVHAPTLPSVEMAELRDQLDRSEFVYPVRTDVRPLDVRMLRTGDRALVRFEFCFRPEFVMVGSKLIFREGRTKGIGKVVRVYHQSATDSTSPSTPASANWTRSNVASTLGL